MGTAATGTTHESTGTAVSSRLVEVDANYNKCPPFTARESNMCLPRTMSLIESASPPTVSAAQAKIRSRQRL